MEIVGVGTDIVECLRIGRMIERHGEAFLWKVYTEREVDFCRERRGSTEAFAACWAAKEAAFKSLGTRWRRGVAWTDVEVKYSDDGKPCLHLRGAAREIARQLQVGKLHLSLAHCRAYATATCIATR